MLPSERHRKPAEAAVSYFPNILSLPWIRECRVPCCLSAPPDQNGGDFDPHRPARGDGLGGVRLSDALKVEPGVSERVDVGT